MRNVWKTLFNVSFALLASACDPALPAPVDAVQADPDLEAFEAAVAWPEPAIETVVILATVYSATGRDQRGFDYFSERSAEDPNDPVMLGFAAVFQARIAGGVPVFQRVAWVEEAMAKLDQAVALDPTLPRFLRAVTYAQLPPSFGVTDTAIAELDELLTSEGSFIFSPQVIESTRQSLLRQGWQAMGAAANTAGDTELAEQAWANAGTQPPSQPGEPGEPGQPLITTSVSVDGQHGFRFSRPVIWSPEPWLHVAQGYDFGDISFVETSEGLVVIDAGTVPENAALALADVRELGAEGPVHTVFVTHAHWDHIGGLEGVLEPGTQVVAHADFGHELDNVNNAAVGYGWFFGQDAARTEPYALNPDILIDATTDLSIGGVDFALHPVRGGETEDALLIELPEHGVVFVGDTYMPYLGAPFVNEGSADELIAATDYLLTLEPELLIHGHPPLTDRWTADALAPFNASLHELRSHTLKGIAEGHSVDELLASAPFPELLSEHPDAVLAVLIARSGFIQRLHQARTGYWQPDGEGVTVVTEGEWAVALDRLAEGDEERWVEVITGLVDHGDLDLAWRMTERGLRAHPDSPELDALRDRALGGMRERYQHYDPFKFIVYSELEGVPTDPLACDGPQC